MPVPPVTSALPSGRSATERTVQERLDYLRLLAAGAFYPAALLGRRACVSRWAETEELTYRDPDAEREARAEYSHELETEPSSYRLTDAGLRLLLTADGLRPERAELGATFGRIIAATPGEYGPGPHPGCAEFEPSPVPQEATRAGLILYRDGWDAVSFYAELTERVDGRWLHERMGWESHVLYCVSPYVLRAAVARRKARVDAGSLMRDWTVFRESGKGMCTRTVRRALLPETEAVLDASYDAWNPCTPAELFRVLRGAGLLSAGNVPRGPEGTRRKRLRHGDRAVDLLAEVRGTVLEDPEGFWLLADGGRVNRLIPRSSLRRLPEGR